MMTVKMMVVVGMMMMIMVMMKLSEPYSMGTSCVPYIAPILKMTRNHTI